MIKIFLLTAMLAICMNCTIFCQENTGSISNPVSTVIMTPHSPSYLAGYHDGWKVKSDNSGYVMSASLLGLGFPFIGNTILFENLHGAVPDSIPAGLDSKLYCKGYQEASLSKRQVSVDIPRRVTNYSWSAGVVMVIGLAVYFDRHPLFGDGN